MFCACLFWSELTILEFFVWAGLDWNCTGWWWWDEIPWSNQPIHSFMHLIGFERKAVRWRLQRSIEARALRKCNTTGRDQSLRGRAREQILRKNGDGDGGGWGEKRRVSQCIGCSFQLSNREKKETLAPHHSYFSEYEYYPCRKHRGFRQITTPISGSTLSISSDNLCLHYTFTNLQRIFAWISCHKCKFHN